MSKYSGHSNNVSRQYHVHSDNACAGVLTTVTTHHASIVCTATTHMLGSWAQALLITHRASSLVLDSGRVWETRPGTPPTWSASFMKLDQPRPGPAYGTPLHVSQACVNLPSPNALLSQAHLLRCLQNTEGVGRGSKQQQQKLQKEAVSQGKIYIFISRQQAHTLQGRARQGPSEPWLRAVSIEACFLVQKLQGRMGRFKYKKTHHTGQGPGLNLVGSSLGFASLVSPMFFTVGHFTCK